MKINIKIIKRFSLLKRSIEIIFSIISFLIVKNNKIALFYGTSQQSYNENSRYLYEFMSKNSTLDCYWVTENDVLLEYLKKHNMKSVNRISTFSIWLHLRARIIISTETSYPNLLGLISKKTIKYCLHHGFGPRTTNMPDGKMYKTQLDIINSINQYSYFTFTSKFSKMFIGNMLLHLPETKCLLNGMPRCDHLLLADSTKLLKIEKNISKKYFNLNSESKIILYAPTWRQNNNEEFMLIKNENIRDIDTVLANNNLFLLLSYHELTSNDLDLNEITNIKVIVKDFLFDINLLLPEIDLLISDYSSIITDYLLLKDSSIAFYVPDLDYYQYTYGLNILYKPNKIGPVITDKNSFKELLFKFSTENYIDTYKTSRNEYLEMFYDVTITNSCQRHMDFIVKRIGGYE